MRGAVGDEAISLHNVFRPHAIGILIQRLLHPLTGCSQ